MEMQSALHKAVAGQDLTESEMIAVMRRVMAGEADASFLAAFLTALKMKGESVGEITGAARVMREHADRVQVAVSPLVDTCGTGGDGADTFNISTAAAFVVAGAGVAVAKHGNRAVSGKSGSADVLKCLGVNIEADKAVVKRCLEEIGIGFLFAPLRHPAMKHAAEVRRILGFRTLFNLLGPLTNPAGAQAQLIGVYENRWTRTLAEVLRDLGTKRAMVVHGADGLDEITLTSETSISSLSNGNIIDFIIKPETFGLRRCGLGDLRGGSPEENAAILRGILEGQDGPRRDVVLLNAAGAIAVADKAESLEEGFALARESLRSGAALAKLEDLKRLSHS
jgi:anthranilate phosphoribosyltransferase